MSSPVKTWLKCHIKVVTLSSLVKTFSECHKKFRTEIFAGEYIVLPISNLSLGPCLRWWRLYSNNAVTLSSLVKTLSESHQKAFQKQLRPVFAGEYIVHPISNISLGPYLRWWRLDSNVTTKLPHCLHCWLLDVDAPDQVCNLWTRCIIGEPEWTPGKTVKLQWRWEAAIHRDITSEPWQDSKDSARPISWSFPRRRSWSTKSKAAERSIIITPTISPLLLKNFAEYWEEHKWAIVFC